MSSLERRKLGKAFAGIVHLNIDSGPDDRDEFNDDEMPCCMSSAMRGPRACTCWEPVYDLEQVEVDEAAEYSLADVHTRPECCLDCAYRNGSPERATGYEAELLDVATEAGSFFACHQGMRRAVAYRHPDGRELPAGDGDYHPPMAGPVAFKADGTPADLCAGWAAHRHGGGIA